MGLEVALGTSLAKVRATQLACVAARAVSSVPVFAVVSPLAPPRLWSWVADGVLKGFEKNLTEVGESKVGKISAVQLQRAVGAGALALSAIQSALIEPHLSLDAQMVAVAVEGGAAHIALSAGTRVYRARAGEPRRLLNAPQRSPGIAHGGMHIATERLQRGDLFVFGSRDAFGMRSIGALAALLAARPDAPAVELCEAAIGPCRSAGLGAGVVVLRVR